MCPDDDEEEEDDDDDDVKRMNVLTKATSAGLDTPLLESQTIQVSTSTGQSLCVGRDEEEDVRQDEEKRNPFTSSPPHGDVCLFGEAYEEERMRVEKKGGSFNHLSTSRHVFLFMEQKEDEKKIFSSFASYKQVF